MKRYRRLLGIFYRNTLMNEMEYRLNFWSLLILQLFWLTWSAIGARIPFQYADRLAGWSYPELLVVLGVFHVMKGVQSIFLHPNLSQMTEYVRMGTLDYILTKPIDSQFMVSLRNLGLRTWADPFLGFALIGYALWSLRYLPSLLDDISFLLILFAASIVLYSLTLAIQSLTFWFVDLEEAYTFVDTIVEAGRFPINFFNGWLRYLLTAIIPVALVTTFPSQAILGRNPAWMVPLSIIIAIVLFVASSVFWRFALRSYTSASS